MLPGVAAAWILTTLASAAGLAVGMGWRPDRRGAAGVAGVGAPVGTVREPTTKQE
jgi:hypothetical protein